MTRRMRVVVGSWMGLCLVAAGALAQDQSSLSRAAAETLAPLLASWIEAERDAMKEQGVQPIPPAIRAALQGYVPDQQRIVARRHS